MATKKDDLKNSSTAEIIEQEVSELIVEIQETSKKISKSEAFEKMPKDVQKMMS